MSNLRYSITYTDSEKPESKTISSESIDGLLECLVSMVDYINEQRGNSK